MYVTWGDGTTVVGHLPPTGGGYCGGTPFWSAYARSGTYFYLLDHESGDTIFRIYRGLRRVFAIRTNAGAAGPAEPIWSPTDDVLYYLRGGDVWRWVPDAGAQQFMTDVTWSSVTISPDGRYLAYAAPARDGSDDTYLVDLTAPDPAPARIGRRREAPPVLDRTQLWLQPEPAGAGCIGRKLPMPVIYDINEMAESPSIIRRVISTWPATLVRRSLSDSLRSGGDRQRADRA